MMYVIIMEWVGYGTDVELYEEQCDAIKRAKEMVADKMSDPVIFRPEISKLPFFAHMKCVGNVQVRHKQITTVRKDTDDSTTPSHVMNDGEGDQMDNNSEEVQESSM